MTKQIKKLPFFTKKLKTFLDIFSKKIKFYTIYLKKVRYLLYKQQ